MLRTTLISLLSVIPTISALRFTASRAPSPLKRPAEHSVGRQEAEGKRWKPEVSAIATDPRSLDFGSLVSPPFETPSRPAKSTVNAEPNISISISPASASDMFKENDSGSANSSPTSRLGEMKEQKLKDKTNSAGTNKKPTEGTTQTPLTKKGEVKRRKHQGDRFIPNRAKLDVDFANFYLTDKSADALDQIVKGQDADGNPIAQQDANYRQLLAKWMLGTEGDASGWRLRGGSAGGSSSQQSSKILNFSGDENRNRNGAQTASSLAMQHLSENMLRMRQVYRENRAGMGSGRRTGELSRGFKRSHSPERILDAPDFLNDYYLNLLDWSSLNVIAVALGPIVYLWDATNATIVQLFDANQVERLLPVPADFVASVRFSPDGQLIAIGCSNGNLYIYNVATRVSTRRILNDAMVAGNAQRLQSSIGVRIAAIDWRDDTYLSCGNKRGVIFNIDLRPNAAIPASIYIGHSEEICGLAWQPEHGGGIRFLAAGSNDNNLTIWDPTFRRETNPVPDARAQVHNDGRLVWPQHRIRRKPMVKIAQDTNAHAHIAAVKALAWCPQRPDLLASGAGTADGTIKLWHVSNSLRSTEYSRANRMAPRFTLQTGAQVAGIVWSLADAGQFISSHGFPCPRAHNLSDLAHHLQIWEVNLRNPNKATFVDKLTGHTGRVLGLRPNPTGDIVVSAAADETLRFWKVFKKHDPRRHETCEMDKFGHCIR